MGAYWAPSWRLDKALTGKICWVVLEGEKGWGALGGGVAGEALRGPSCGPLEGLAAALRALEGWGDDREGKGGWKMQSGEAGGWKGGNRASGIAGG